MFIVKCLLVVSLFINDFIILLEITNYVMLHLFTVGLAVCAPPPCILSSTTSFQPGVWLSSRG